MMQAFKVEMKAHQIFEEKLQMKVESAQRHEKVKEFKNFIAQEADKKKRVYFIQKTWLRMIFAQKLVGLISDKLTVF